MHRPSVFIRYRVSRVAFGLIQAVSILAARVFSPAFPDTPAFPSVDHFLKVPPNALELIQTRFDGLGVLSAGSRGRKNPEKPSTESGNLLPA